METRINLKVHWEEDGYEYMFESGKCGTDSSEYKHSHNLHLQGWEHVHTCYYPDWDIDMLHRKRITNEYVSNDFKIINLIKKIKSFFNI